ncbi:MAG: DUF3185 family protein [Phycisphaerales bacterium]
MHVTYETPPTVAGQLPKRPIGGPASNIPGLLGLIFNGSGLLTSFTCLFFLGIPLLFVGTILSIVGCFIKPRILAVIGLIIGLLAFLVLGALLGVGAWQHFNTRNARGLTPLQVDRIAESCSALTTEVEKIRSTTGNLPVVFNIGAFPEAGVDPWNHWYRYIAVPVTRANPYGYTFISDGPDGIANTPDDLDIIAIHPADDEDHPLPAPPPSSSPLSPLQCLKNRPPESPVDPASPPFHAGKTPCEQTSCKPRAALPLPPPPAERRPRMASNRIIGLVMLVIGVVLLIVGINASDSLADQLSETFTGKFTDSTTWYILGGAALALIGGAVAFVPMGKLRT